MEMWKLLILNRIGLKLPRVNQLKMVGAEGFEPPTLWSQTRCATRLRYAPTDLVYRIVPSSRSEGAEESVSSHAKHRMHDAAEEPSEQDHRE